jgi:RNA polymerase sigma factor (sigma-70 family)
VTAHGNPLTSCGHDRSVEASDAVLWARSRAGDADAFGLLFERHAKSIYNYCFRRVGNRATAEDLLSVVFLEAWRRRDSELRLETPLPFLYGIATNVIHHQRRSERRHAAALSRLSRPRAELDFSADSADRVDVERRALDALHALRRLPKREQDIFVLCVGMELTYEEAAAALGLPIGTVRSRLSRARGRLRELEIGSGHKEGESTKYKEARQP